MGEGSSSSMGEERILECVPADMGMGMGTEWPDRRDERSAGSEKEENVLEDEKARSRLRGLIPLSQSGRMPVVIDVGERGW
jgi:hypothetical protein